LEEIKVVDGKAVTEISTEQLEKKIQMKEQRLVQIDQRVEKLGEEKVKIASEIVELKAVQSQVSG